MTPRLGVGREAASRASGVGMGEATSLRGTLRPVGSEYRVALSWEEVADRFEARPEVAPGGPFHMVRHPRRLVIRYARKRPPYENYELMPQQLWVEGHREGRTLRVRAAVTSRPSPRGFAEALALAVSMFAANVLTDLADLRDTRQRRREERAELLGVAAATLAPLEVGDERGPFRD